MYQNRLIAGFAFALFALSGLASATDRKVALVFGNGEYRAITRLANPVNDARSAGDLFSRMGFETDIILNADKARMEDALARFRVRSDGADAALIYFAGHGIQADNRNFLLGVDTDGNSLDRVAETALHMDQMVAGFAPNVATKLLFLDACRNNPFAQSTRALNTGAELSRGLARSNHSAADLLVIYAAQPSKTALDGAGTNSPFMEAITAAMGDQPEVRLTDALFEITNRVRTKTRGLQIPYIEGSPSRNLKFTLANPLPLVRPASVTSCQGSTASLTTPFNTDENFTELPGRDKNILINGQVNICIEDDRVEVSGPFSATFPCAAFFNAEGVGYYFTDTTGQPAHIWLYADPANSPTTLEFGLHRGEEELQWIATNRPVCR